MQSGKVAELLLDVNVSMVLTGPQPCAKQTTNSIVQVPCVFPIVKFKMFDISVCFSYNIFHF